VVSEEQQAHTDFEGRLAEMITVYIDAADGPFVMGAPLAAWALDPDEGDDDWDATLGDGLDDWEWEEDDAKNA
jgi:hypothetical protein